MNMTLTSNCKNIVHNGQNCFGKLQYASVFLASYWQVTSCAFLKEKLERCDQRVSESYPSKFETIWLRTSKDIYVFVPKSNFLRSDLCWLFSKILLSIEEKLFHVTAKMHEKYEWFLENAWIKCEEKNQHFWRSQKHKRPFMSCNSI